MRDRGFCRRKIQSTALQRNLQLPLHKLRRSYLAARVADQALITDRFSSVRCQTRESVLGSIAKRSHWVDSSVHDVAIPSRAESKRLLCHGRRIFPYKRNLRNLRFCRLLPISDFRCEPDIGRLAIILVREKSKFFPSKTHLQIFMQ